MPQPLTQLPPPPPNPPAIRPERQSLTPEPDSSECPPSTSVPSTFKSFRTARNAFGIVREYLSHEPPAHDPEAFLEFEDLCDHGRYSDGCLEDGLACHDQSFSGASINSVTGTPFAQPSLGPYPNQTSFLLGDWYWNGGRQKSYKDFRSLLTIVGSPEFRPEDVRDTKWKAIDTILGHNDFDQANTSDIDDDAWLDDDAGWTKSPITISVPFHQRAKQPGPKDFFVGDLYHRSLTSVIRERLTNPQDAQFFHYEPFKLLWRPHPTGAEMRIHGEIYNSPEFLAAHDKLQSSPNEPGCTRPKVIVAMMFLSDATHLTQFGTAKLWPCYLMFGNDSKYRRCKPTCNLCSHVAYFQTVNALYINFYYRELTKRNILSAAGLV